MNEKHRLRALILQEYVTRRTDELAHENICQELGLDAVSLKEVQKWYAQFNAGDTNLRDEDDPEYDEPLPIDSDVYLKANKAVLFKTTGNKLRGSFVTVDGRLGFTYYKKTIKAMDIFRGRIVVLSTDYELELPDYVGIRLIKNSRLFLLETLKRTDESYLARLFVVDLDYNTSEFHVVTKIERALEPGIYEFPMDRSNMSSFGIFGDHGYIFELQDDHIAVSDCHLDGRAPELFCTKLDGNKLCDLHYSQEKDKFQYCQYDLQTMIAKTTETPSISEKFKSFFHNPLTCLIFTWSGDFLYTCFDHREEDSIYRLDAATGRWARFQFVVLGEITWLSVSGDFMTIQSIEENIDGAEEITIYRVPLRRPDTLANLA